MGSVVDLLAPEVPDIEAEILFKAGFGFGNGPSLDVDAFGALLIFELVVGDT